MYMYHVYNSKLIFLVMVSRAPSLLSHLLQKKQVTSGIFAFYFHFPHDVDLRIVIERVIS